jgi:hypothetical protein
MFSNSQLNVRKIDQLRVLKMKLGGATDDEAVADLCARGYDRELASQLIKALLSSVVAESVKLQKIIAKQNSILQIFARSYELTNRSEGIPCYDGLEERAFIEHYSRSLPAIFRGGCRGWSAFGKWSPQYFLDKFGSAEIEIVNKPSEVSYFSAEMTRVKTTMARFAEAVMADRAQEFYMVARNLTLSRSSFAPLFRDIGPLPSILRPSTANGFTNLWFGPGGTVTPLHHDRTNIFFAQLYGEKRFRMASPANFDYLYNDTGVFSRFDPEKPDYVSYPLARLVKLVSGIVGPGDVVFLPIAWWHHVRSLSTSISIITSDFVLPNRLSIADP